MDAHLDDDRIAALALDPGSDEPEHVRGCTKCGSRLESFRHLAGDLSVLREPPAHLREAAAAYFERRTALDALIGSLAEDPALRLRAERDPEAVLREHGLQPTPELLAAIRDLGRGAEAPEQRLAAKFLWF